MPQYIVYRQGLNLYAVQRVTIRTQLGHLKVAVFGGDLYRITDGGNRRHAKMEDMRAILLLTLSTLILAQENWQAATSLAGVDLTGLTPAQQASALKILREQGCSCGCSMKIAECRVKDPACGVSKGLAALVVKGLKDGKTPAEVSNSLVTEAAKAPAPPPVLEDPIAISIANDPVRGPAHAKVTIVEFSDFQCPYCAAAAGKMTALMAKYPNDVRLVFKQFPLDIHGQAQMAAQASLAAAKQDKFWELHDKMFANFRRLNRDNVITWAKDLGLDMPRFLKDMDSAEVKARVTTEIQEGVYAGVAGTPTLFINGKKYNGAVEVERLSPIIEQERR